MAEVKIVPVAMKMGPLNVMAYLLIGDRVVVLDTGIAGQAGRILERLTAEGRAASDVSLILLTHGHGDHAGSAAALRAATGAPVALGAGDEQKALVGRDTEMRARPGAGDALMRVVRRLRAHSPVGEGPVPDIVIDGERSLAEFGIDATVVPTPGHTRGSLSVFTASGDALVGDLLGGAGRSRPEPRAAVFASDEAAVDAGIRMVIARRPRRVFTGHDARPFTLEQMTAVFGDA